MFLKKNFSLDKDLFIVIEILEFHGLGPRKKMLDSYS